MYLLDTNVVSELRKAKSGRADPRVLAWSTTVLPSTLFLSVITILELEQGLLAIKRRDGAQGALLRAWLDGAVLPTFADRILPIDTAVARRCAALHVPDPFAERDALIAATALVHGLAVVTRNAGKFVRSEVRVVDPWQG